MISRVDLLIGLPNCGQMEYALHTLTKFYAEQGLQVMVLTDVQKEVNMLDAEEDVLIITDPELCKYETLLFVEASVYRAFQGAEITRTYFENNLPLALRGVEDTNEKEWITNLSKEYFTPLFVIRTNYEE